MRRARPRRRLLLAVAVTPVLAVGLLLTGALSGAPVSSPAQETSSPASADPLVEGIAAAQDRLRRVPRDSRTWASLALLYVSRARTTGDPSWYVKAEGATAESLRLDRDTNDLGYAAQAAISSGRHDFAAALASARRGLAVNRYSATLYGALADALVQLGRYDEASAAVGRLNRLKPGVPAFTRASYDRELRGDISGARAALEQALRVAVSPADQAFAQTYLSELNLAYQGRYGGTASRALEHVDAGLRLTPRDPALRDARARALVALGRTDEAVSLYLQLVAQVPQPQYVLEFGELLQSLGRGAEAEEQYSLLRAEEKLLRGSGVRLDVEATLFAADHGTPSHALAVAREGWRSRPFLEMADAYAWALYRNGAYAEALRFSNRALSTGWPSALARYHRGMVEKALGRDTAARQDLRTSLTLNPSFHPVHAKVARQALASLGG